MPYVNKPRPYKHEWEMQKKRGAKERERRAERAKARYDVEKEKGQLSPNLVIDHKKPLSAGGSNKPSNWRLEPRDVNASFSRTSTHKVKKNRPTAKEQAKLRSGK